MENIDYNENDTTVTEKSKPKCEDSKDCQELGIVDLDACDFAPWAIERCPLTCGVCKVEGILTLFINLIEGEKRDTII